MQQLRCGYCARRDGVEDWLHASEAIVQAVRRRRECVIQVGLHSVVAQFLLFMNGPKPRRAVHGGVDVTTGLRGCGELRAVAAGPPSRPTAWEQGTILLSMT